MATNRTPQEALDFAKRIIGNSPLDDAELKYRVLQDPSDYIHMAAAWRWSVGQLTKQLVVSGTEDYTVTDPTDLRYLVRAELRFSDGHREFLTPVHSLTASGITKGSPREISLVNSTTVRLYPIPNYTAGLEPSLIVDYKKKNTNITAGNIGTAATLLFDDEWFHVYQAGVLAHAFMFTDNPRLGAVTVGNQSVQFSGQWGVFQGLLVQMAQKEKPLTLELGVPSNG